MRNIVLLTFDSLRADHCSFQGYNRDTTPTLDEMVKEAVSFSNAFSPASRTPYSVSGMFTGEHVSISEKISNPEHTRRHLSKNKTIAQQLSGMGYQTAAFCPSAYASHYYGFDEGFDKYQDFLSDDSIYKKIFQRHIEDTSATGAITAIRNAWNFIFREETFKTWDRYIDEIEGWVNKPREEPFFLWVFAQDTHIPHLIPRRYRNWSNLLDIYRYNWLANSLIDELEPELTDKEREKIIDIYDDSIRYGDYLIKRMQKLVEEFDPVFIVTSDHGEAFFEHGKYGHFYPSAYDENVHVPLVISGTNDGPRTIEKPVSLTQLPNILRSASEGKIPDSFAEYAITNEYDGRWERRVISVRSDSEKYILEVNHDGIVEEFYKDGERVNSNQVSDEIVSRGLQEYKHQLEKVKMTRAVGSTV